MYSFDLKSLGYHSSGVISHQGVHRLLEMHGKQKRKYDFEKLHILSKLQDMNTSLHGAFESGRELQHINL